MALGHCPLLPACRPFALHRGGKQLQRGLGSDMGMQPREMLQYVSGFFPVTPGARALGAALVVCCRRWTALALK